MTDLYVSAFWFALSGALIAVVFWWMGMFDGMVSTLSGLPEAARGSTRLLVPAVAALAGVTGTWLLATPNHPALGFGAFLVSNLAWLSCSLRNPDLGYFVRQRFWRLLFQQRDCWFVLQQIAFLVATVTGLWNWWLKPLLVG